MRYSAWLNAVPEKQKLSRLEQMRANGVEPELPECTAAYVAGFLWEIGPADNNGMGQSPISHLEMAAWQANTGVDLSSWEARTLRSLSLAYLGEVERAREPGCPSPWLLVPTEEAREQLPKRIRSVLRG